MIRTVLAYVLFLCLAIPSVKAWQHVLDGHIEIHCKEDIPSHFHQAEFSCDLHKFHFSMSLQAPVLELGENPALSYLQFSSGIISAPECQAVRLFCLRAPPV